MDEFWKTTGGGAVIGGLITLLGTSINLFCNYLNEKNRNKLNFLQSSLNKKWIAAEKLVAAWSDTAYAIDRLILTRAHIRKFNHDIQKCRALLAEEQLHPSLNREDIVREKEFYIKALNERRSNEWEYMDLVNKGDRLFSEALGHYIIYFENTPQIEELRYHFWELEVYIPEKWEELSANKSADDLIESYNEIHEEIEKLNVKAIDLATKFRQEVETSVKEALTNKQKVYGL